MMKPMQSFNMQKSTVHFINEQDTEDSVQRSLTNPNSSRYALLSHHQQQHQHHPHHSQHQHHHQQQHQPVQIVTSNYYHQSNVFAMPPSSSAMSARSGAAKSRSKLVGISRTNLVFSLALFAALLVYNAQNLIFYKLNELNTGTQMILFCAFDDSYADYYSMLTQFLVPFLNLFLFAVLPLTLLTVQVLLDVCFLIRVRREQLKRYMKLSEIIEWPLYAYYLVAMLAHLPYALHQLVDLCAGTSKFPFVFPLFIQMKFSSHVWLVIIEQMLIFIGCGADLFIWLLVDKQMRELATYWLNKRIFCRTYTKVNISTLTVFN